MARGTNLVGVSGNIGGEISFGETHGGDQFCSFQVAVEGRSKAVTWVRVNVYGPLVNICRDRLKRGLYVSVKGELMNRSNNSDFTEVRCEDIAFVYGGSHDTEKREDFNQQGERNVAKRGDSQEQS